MPQFDWLLPDVEARAERVRPAPHDQSKVVKGIIAVSCILTLTRTANAAWPANPLVNLPISTATGVQAFPSIAPDGAGGAFIAWHDTRSGATSDIYLARVTASGSIASGWPLNGLALCTASGNQLTPSVASDMSGGVYVVWQDARSGPTNDIYGTHVSSDGTITPGWGPDGEALCSAPGNQTTPKIASDGSGGATVAWIDFRSDTTSDVFAGHLLPGGIDPSWPVDGRSMCLAPGNQNSPTVASSTPGGVFVAWRDLRDPMNADIRASMVLNSGLVPPGWPTDGLPVCAAQGNQQNPEIAATTDGSAIVTWTDFRAGPTSDIYAQKVLPSAVVDPAWPADGVSVCDTTGNQQLPRVAPDEQNGAYIVWQDIRIGSLTDIYVQHVTSGGAVVVGWPKNGAALCTASGSQQNASITGDGRGGAIVAWQDRRGTNLDIHSGHLLESGIDPTWLTDGVPVCSAPQNQQVPVLIPDRTGGAIIAWIDGRAAPSGDDIYAQRILANGTLGGDVVGVGGPTANPGMLGPPEPNPWRGGKLRLPLGDLQNRDGEVRIVDVAGRVRARFPVSAGSHGGLLELDPAALPLEPGRFIVRLSAGGIVATRPLVVVGTERRH